MELGLKYVSKTLVSEKNSARTLGSGDMDVFATPAMIALMENAAMHAVEAHLPQGSTTVGAQMNTSHVKPTALGAEVQATAILTEMDGRKLTFAVKAEDAGGVIGEGVHVRFVVDRVRFMTKLKE